MKKEISATKKRIVIILVTIALSVLLYLAGVYSGLYANKILEKKTTEDISILKQGTEKELQSLNEYINFLETTQGRILLEQEFQDTLTDQEKCEFSDIYMTQLFDELNYYWQRFPFRIEEYEYKNQPLSQEYIDLKNRYTQLSIRTWILAKTRYEKCNKKLVHGLNFYTTDCSECAKQGEQIDQFGPELRKEGVEALIFTIDLDSKEPIIKFLRQYYNLTTAPALLLNGKVFTGRVYKTDELIDDVKDTIK